MGKLSLFTAERKGIYTDWRSWPTGEPVTGSPEWLEFQKSEGLLPEIKYRWAKQGKADLREQQGSYKKVWWLDADQKTKHVICNKKPTDNVLTADTEEWDGALER